MIFRLPAPSSIGLSCALVGCLLAIAQNPPIPDPQASVRQLIQRYIDIRNSRDQTGLQELFCADADQLVSNGQWRHGRIEIVAGAIASSKKENGRSALQVESVRFLTPDVAIADGRYQTMAADSPATRNMWSSFVLKKVNGAWRIAAIRNMLPAGANVETGNKPSH